MRRRTFLAASAGTTAALGLAHGTTLAHAGTSDHQRIIDNMVRLQTGTPETNTDPIVAKKVTALVTTARNRLAALDPARSQGIFKNLPLGTSEANIAGTVMWLADIALVTVLPGAPADLRGNTQIRQTVLDNLAALQERWLKNQDAGYYGNWYQWEIGYPTHMSKLMCYLADELRTTHRDLLTQLVATMDGYLRAGKNGDVDLDSRFHTGANLADITANRVVQGALLGDDARIAKAVSDQATVYATVDPNNLVHGVTDGHYADGSFIQHSSVAYTGSYGKVLLQRSIQTITLLDGTTWNKAETLVPVVHRWIAEAFAPVIYEGWMMEAVKGRGHSRTTSGYTDVLGVIESATDLGTYLSGEAAIEVKSWVKYLTEVTRVTVDPSRFVSPMSIVRYRQLMADATIPARNIVPAVATFAFNSMERNVHLRPGYGFALSRSSSRISKYEYMSGENLRPWFLGDGSHQLYLHGVDQTTAFGVDELAAISPYHRPGTSAPVEQRRTIPELYGKAFYENVEQGFTASSITQNQYVYFPLGTNPHSGGAHLGAYATATLVLSDDAAHLAKVKGELPPDFVTWANCRGRRSWFMFDDQIVVLSAGVGDRTRAVVTTIDARLSAAGGHAEVQAGAGTGALGVGDHDRLEWAHWKLGEAQVGYRLLTPRAATVTLAEVDYTQQLVRTPNPTTPLRREVFDLTLSTPAGANESMAWALLPGADVATTRGELPVEVLANSEVAQAVRHSGLGITMVNSYDARTHHVGGIKVKGVASVVVHEHDGLAEVAISDPVFTQRSISMELSGRWRLVEAGEGMSVRTKPNKAELVADVAGAHGASITAVLKRA